MESLTRRGFMAGTVAALAHCLATPGTSCEVGGIKAKGPMGDANQKFRPVLVSASYCIGTTRGPLHCQFSDNSWLSFMGSEAEGRALVTAWKSGLRTKEAVCEWIAGRKPC